MNRPCPYGDKNCTGIHSSKALRAQLCPSARERLRARARTAQVQWRKRNPDYNGTYLGKRYAENIRRLQEIKLERGCMDCGFRAHPAALDFDHRPGVNKVSEVSKLTLSSWELILAEIAKCDVRCANCHRIITAERRKESA